MEANTDPVVSYESNYLCISGYKYRKSYVSTKAIVTWRCTSKTCPATIKSDPTGKLLDPNNIVHTHKAPLDVNEISKSQNHSNKRICVSPVMKNAAVNTPSRRNSMLPTDEGSLREIELQQQRDDLINHSFTLQTNLQAASDEKDYISEENRKAQDTIRKLNSELDSLMKENIKLKNAVNNDNIKLVQETEFLDTLKTSVHKDRVISRLDDYNNTLIREVEELQSEIESYRTIIKELDLKIKSLQNKFDTTDSPKKRSNSKKNGRVFVVADSQGRRLQGLLQETLSDFWVTGDIHPGAPLHRIAESVCSLKAIKDCSKEDYVFVLGGTNNFSEYSSTREIQIFRNCLENIIKECRSTNLIIASIPYRYDTSWDSVENRLIKQANEHTRNICRKHNVHFVDIWSLERKAHTRHGLHLSNFGKNILARKIVDIVCSGSVVNIMDSNFNSPIRCGTSLGHLTLTEPSVDIELGVDETECAGIDSDANGRCVDVTAPREIDENHDKYVNNNGNISSDFLSEIATGLPKV
jgi:lysophospholipase L1-like esterase